MLEARVVVLFWAADLMTIPLNFSQRSPSLRGHFLSDGRAWLRAACFIILVGFSPGWAMDADDWEIAAAFGDDLYPSVIVGTSTMKSDEEDEADLLVLGDPFGLIGASVTAPRDNAKFRVEVSSRKLIEPSVIEGRLRDAGEVYEIYPNLNFDYDALLRVRQPYPELVKVKVWIDGKPAGTNEQRMLVRSANDCPFGYVDEDGEYNALDALFAVYVNENHPEVDDILSEALRSGDTETFAGYQGDQDDVVRELQAVWNALQRRGFAYSSITRPSADDNDVYVQHVRLIGDSVRTSQANCVDGSVLFASVFRKLGMEPFLVSVPGHMFVGVYLDEEQNDFTCIETTMLGNASFLEAVEAGNKQFAKYEDELTSEESEDPSFALVDISAARKMGILPLREPKLE